MSQGSPTSPILSNILLADFDDLVTPYCQEQQIIYTRYSDVIYFSTNTDMNLDNMETCITNKLIFYKLTLNSNKTKFFTYTFKITGINISYHSLTVSRTFKKQVKQELQFISKNGCNLVCKHHVSIILTNKITSTIYIYGRINYINQVEPDYVDYLYQDLNLLFRRERYLFKIK